MKIELYNIVNVDQYVNRLISQFLSLSSDLSQGDILIADKINKLLEKNQSRYMLKNIDNFMNKNCLDPRVNYLYVTRNKLFKFIQKVQQNKLIKQVNSIPNSEEDHNPRLTSQNTRMAKETSNKKSPKTANREPYQKHKQTTENKNHDTIRFDEYPGKSKENKNPYENNFYEKQKTMSEFSSFQRKQPSYPKNIKKPDPIKIQPESPVFLKAKTPTKLKPNNQDEKYNYEIKRPKQSSGFGFNPVVKTSKKTESFTPARGSNTKGGTEPYKGMKSARDMNDRSKGMGGYQKSGRNTSVTPENKKTNKTERTPSRSTNEKGKITESHLYNEYSNGPQNNNGYNNGSSSKGMNLSNNSKEEPSSAIKNLSNLIFTIKMTRQEYNEFKKIKQQHEGKFMVE